jgi:ribokinase
MSGSERGGGGGASRRSAPSPQADLDVIGFGSMVLDRMHQTRRILGANEKGLLDDVAGGSAVELCIGGLMLNQLGWASLFGVRAGLFGRQGDDEVGRTLRGAMAQAGIETDLDLSGGSSSFAEIFIDREGERVIYMAAGATAETRPEHVRTNHAAFLARGRRLTTEVSQLPLDTTRAALELAHELGLETVVDLDVLPSDAIVSDDDGAHFDAILRAADVLKPTATAVLELFPHEKDLEGVSHRVREAYSVPRVVITDGERGALLADAEGVRRVPAYRAARVLDSTGAGDAFLGGFLAGETLGLSALEAVRLGNATGATCVERLGAFPDDSKGLRARIFEIYDGPLPARLRS